jgi:hypothetical protein
MRVTILFSSLFFLSVLFISCEKDVVVEPEYSDQLVQEYEIPEIPEFIARRMSESDIIKFKAGPGEAFLKNENAERGRSRWHPVLMFLNYNLQFVPIGGESCQPGEFVPCFGPYAPPDADPNECLANLVGTTGLTYASGNWLRKNVYSEYYPVFCAPDYSGYGSGFYLVESDKLVVEAQNNPFNYDEMGNSWFYRYGTYNGGLSSGIFEGAYGWEIMISYTPYETNPGLNPQGIGESQVVIFGWVKY